MLSVFFIAGLLMFFCAVTLLVIALGTTVEAVGRQDLVTQAGTAVMALFPRTLFARYDRLLFLAGSPRDMTVSTFIGVKVIAVPIGLLVPLVLSEVMAISFFRSFLVILGFMVIAFFIPDFWLSQKAKGRQHQIRRDLPDTLDLLTINVEAGLSFDSAIGRLIDKIPGPLSEEFSRLLREIQLGRSRTDALKALTARTNVPELNSFVLAIIEADLFGISIGQTMRTQSKDMRVRRRQNAEQVAMKTPVKIIFPLILLIFPSILIVVVGPAGIRIFNILGS